MPLRCFTRFCPNSGMVVDIDKIKVMMIDATIEWIEISEFFFTYEQKTWISFNLTLILELCS